MLQLTNDEKISSQIDHRARRNVFLQNESGRRCTDRNEIGISAASVVNSLSEMPRLSSRCTRSRSAAISSLADSRLGVNYLLLGQFDLLKRSGFQIK